MWTVMLSTLAMAFALVSVATATPLDDYVNTPDSHYSYTFMAAIEGPGYTMHIINMTSQKWMDETVVVNPIWWHHLCIIIPDQIEYKDSAYLWIDGGSNHDSLPKLSDESIQTMILSSVSTKSVTGVIKQIPNQPTEFVADPNHKARYEDAIIAWTWKTFIENGPETPEILLRMPMTKAVVRGFDTITDYVKNKTGNSISRFVIGGASKRGWTTWTTTAVDRRVIGMTPCVMDLLDVQKNLHHHYRSLGGWTFAFEDYYKENITKDLDHPNMPKMLAIIDPLSYKDRYTMPKLIITTSGDEFFLPDDSHYYYDQLTGPKFLRIVPNAEHSMSGHSVSIMFGIRSFYMNVVEKSTFPSLTWERQQTPTGGRIVASMSEKPTTVIVYHAKTFNDGRRDFRLATGDPKTGKPVVHPVIWFSSEATKISDTEYEAEIARPTTGWAAFFIQVTFAGIRNSSLEFTTEVNIVPDTFPFPDCSGAGCFGKLV